MEEILERGVMDIECENCHSKYVYDAEKYDYEPFQCQNCGNIIYVMDW